VSAKELNWNDRLAHLEQLAGAEAPRTLEYIHALLQHTGSEEPDWEEILTAFLASEPPDAVVRAVGIRAWTEQPDEPGGREHVHVRLILSCYPPGEFNDPTGGYMLTGEIKRRLYAIVPPSWELKINIATEAEWRGIEARKDFCDQATIRLGKP